MRKTTILSIILSLLLIYLLYTKVDFIYLAQCCNPVTLYKRLTYKPTVSMVIPTYNMAKSLSEAIDSTINQTYEDWELIVINDGSLDYTKDVLKKYANNYKIRIFHNKKNLGVTRTANIGLKKARGKYIARLDADDYNLPDRLERQTSLMEKENLDFLSQTHYYTDKIENEKPDNLDTYSNGIELFSRVYFSNSAAMLRKSFLTNNNLEYNIEYTSAEDYDLWLAIFFNGGKIGTIGGQPVSVYRPARHNLAWWNKVIINQEKIRIHYLSKIIPNFNQSKILPLSLCELLPFVIEGNKTTKVLKQQELEKQYDLKCNTKK